MKKILFLLAPLALAAYSCGNSAQTQQQDTRTESEIVIENILSRKSVRSYTSQAVEQEKIDLMLKAGMAAPSGSDRRPWHIIVVNDKGMMETMRESLPYAKMLGEAPIAIIVCGDEERSPNWFLDCSAVTQNILLAAETLELGAVWTGAYPYPDRMAAVSEALKLPSNIIPLCVIPMGYPNGEQQAKDKYDPAKVHYNTWTQAAE